MFVMSELALAALFAVFIWWFSTGIVLLLNRMPRSAIRWSLMLSSLLGVAALAGLVQTARQTGEAAAYCAFTCALLVWGWHELSFLTGWITGPRTTALPPGLPERRRFIEAVRAILWHEIGIIVVGSMILAITWDAPNPVGSRTFLVLWVMRTSAKLNLFFGVRNLSEAFLPAHLAYLESFFRRRPCNRFFPFAVTAATAVLAVVVLRALDPATAPAQAVGLSLVGTMLALAIVEHALLVLPVDTTALWRWAIRARRNPAPGAASARPPAARECSADSIENHDKLIQIR